MPRQRPRRRRRRTSSSSTPTAPAVENAQIERTEQPRRRTWLPTAGVVTAMGLGIWLGWTFTIAGGIAEDIALWVGVLMAGLGGGRLFRRSFQARRDRRNGSKTGR